MTTTNRISGRRKEMLDFVEFCERKVLNELAVRIDHKSLKSNLEPYTVKYFKERNIMDRLYSINSNSGNVSLLRGSNYTPENKKDMKLFKIKNRNEALYYYNVISMYNGKGYAVINSFLRDRKTFKSERIKFSGNSITNAEHVKNYTKPDIKKIDFLIKNDELLKPTILYRTMGYTLSNYDDSEEDMVKRGDKNFLDFAYMSCSVNQKLLGKRKSRTHFIILCPKPFHGLAIGYESDKEYEILLPRKSRFLINNVRQRKNGSKIVTMTMFRQKI